MMARLSLYLPPAAGDYSGAASTLFGLDCLVVIVDAGCCTRNYTEYDEPRWARRRKTAFSAQLRTLEAALGDESRIIEQTADMACELGVSCIALLGTPVPAVTGMDLAGIACEVEDVAGVPTLGIETNGFETYERGASKALTALLGRFVCDAAGQQANQNPARSPEAPHVNILGLGPQDFLGEDDMNACVRWFEEAGAVVDFVTSSEYTLTDVARAGSADLSVVVAWSGLEAARLLKERCGVPYVVGPNTMAVPCATMVPPTTASSQAKPPASHVTTLFPRKPLGPHTTALPQCKIPTWHATTLPQHKPPASHVTTLPLRKPPTPHATTLSQHSPMAPHAKTLPQHKPPAPRAKQPRPLRSPARPLRTPSSSSASKSP